MTATTVPIVKDKELTTLGMDESANVNYFDDFIPIKSNGTEEISEKDKNDFINTFICHLIFYAFFCISLVLHIIIDLGLGSFVKNKFIQLISTGKNIFFEKSPAFA
tara:strand:+ start:118 stop:435 length:318 start_codon:yes stop_codon:yes gene_type:complete